MSNAKVEKFSKDVLSSPGVPAVDSGTLSSIESLSHGLVTCSTSDLNKDNSSIASQFP